MKCWKCGMELEEDSVFCDNCGAKTTDQEGTEAGGFPAEGEETDGSPAAPAFSTAQQPSPQDGKEGQLEQGPWVFCPNCGKRFAEGEAFCDDCGASLLEDKPLGAQGQAGNAKKPFNKALLAIPAAVAVVGLGVFGMSLIGGGNSGEKTPTKLAYFQEESLMLIDLKKKKGEPVEITDSYVEEYGYYEGEDILSPDGTYLFYKEDYDGDTYKLFRSKVSKPDEGEEIDTRVTGHEILKDNTVLYEKKERLYWFNGKSSVDFGKNIGYCKVDEDAKYVVWSESQDEEGATFYYQDLAQKNDKVELEKNVDQIRISQDFTKFYVLKNNDKLYVVDNKGNSESLDKDVTEIKSFNPETGEMYYIKSKPEEVKYSEVVFDDTNLMTADERESLDSETFKIPYSELYYCGRWDAEPLMISENYGQSYGSNGTYCLFAEYPSIEEVKVKWSDMASDGWSYAAQKAFEADSLLKLAVEGVPVAEYEDVDYSSSQYNKDSGKLYIYSEDVEKEDGVIYVTSLKGKGAGELTEYDDDASSARLLFATDQGLYYLKDYEENSGDLYFNGERIKSDVTGACDVDKGRLVACASDYYEGTFELSLYNGKKDSSVAKDVMAAECAPDGTVVLLSDYDAERSEGDLMYFDGKELRELDTEVSTFAVRRGSAVVR